MKITRIRLSGFKSFVEPTELHVEPGLTGIVGPNGCGKSNLLEALRWAMGENSAKSMRGTGMEDVIFAGTAQRSARSMAEVTIFMDNQAREAPAAFNDTDHLEVTRRIERDAGSIYRVNGREVRMRDVQLLFADASTGAHSPALVRQGQIGQIIAAKPLQRRAILEEAAGISGLHTRRHEAELRLRGAETNLGRLNDVIGELETQLQGLKRQARQATRYRNLSGLIRQAEAVAFHLRWQGAAQGVSDAEQVAAIAERDAADATERAAAASTAQTEAHSVLPALRETEVERAAAFQRLRVERDQLDAEERRARDTAQRLERQLGEIASDIARESERGADAARTIEMLDAEIAAIAEAGEGREAVLAEAEQTAEAARLRSADAEAALDTARAEAARIAARRQALGRAAEDARRRLERLIQTLDSNAAELARAESDAANAPDVAEAIEAVEAAREATETARCALSEAEATRATAASDVEALREPLSAAEREVAKLKAEESAIAKVLGTGGGLWPKLIDALRVTPGYEAAIAAALGDDLDVPLDEASPIHWRTLPAMEQPAALPEGIASLAAFVEAPDALTRRLAHVGVVAGDEGDALQASLPAGVRLVSREGALWRWDGFRSAAEAETPAAIRLAQRNRLEALRGEVSEAEAKSGEARAAFHAARERSEAAGEAERAARNALRLAEQALAGAERSAAEAEREAIRHSARVNSLRETSERLAGERGDADAAAMEAAEGLEAIAGEDDPAPRIPDMQGDVHAARAGAAEARGAVETAKRELAAAAARNSAAHREREDWTRRADAARAQIEALETRREASAEELETVSAIPAAIEEKRFALNEALSIAEQARREAAEALAMAEALAQAASREAKAADSALSDARETRALRAAALDNARGRLAETAARIREALECEPGELLAKAEHEEGDALPALEQIDAKVERLKKERESLGGVNLRADEEAQDYELRLSSMQAEKADLESAIAKLRGAIGSLNREGRERLLAAFDTVNGHFKRLFTTLFGGGEAELTLTESDDPLEAGLEILARPPGKKLATLSLLSGGEQTLTALSLIFAIFLSNPSPICVLDEVDAPLDDANIERFCNLMDEMTKLTETRFLVITHHAYTMARMDRLMGVTMQERGVSQLVSVDLAGAEQVLAAE
ncbi:MAG: chromosome segregation protein SMC [Alphaproteobacteria bacterium]|nr:chromosome segregation protein SMC [Alphaproteobacteria bacterium]